MTEVVENISGSARLLFYASAMKHLGIGMLVGLSVCFDTAFKKVKTMSCKVYTVQSVYTGQGPGRVHVYTLWAEHSQE